MTFEDMPDKSKFCYRHKRLVQSMVKRWFPKRVNGGSKNQFHVNPFAREWQEFEPLYNKCPAPPSRFSALCLDYEENFPVEQNGARPAFPLLQWLENEKRITGVRKGCRMQYMCRSDGIEHIMKNKKSMK